MKTYQTITKRTTVDFDASVNEIMKRHRKQNPRLEHFTLAISPGSTMYYSGVVSWGKDENEVTFELDQKADPSNW